MNKRFIYIAIIIIVLVAVCFIEQILITSYFSNIENKVKELNQIVETSDNINTTEISGRVDELETTWNSYETNLCFFVNLKDIEDVGLELTKMKVYVAENSIEEFKTSLSLILYHIDSYYNIMGVSFENIF